MPDKELTSVQRYVLLTLMINAAPLARKDATSLTPAQRNELKDWGYIEVVGKPMTLELTQKGHDRAVGELDGTAGSGSVGLAFSAALSFISNLIKQTGTKPENLFRFRLAGPVVAAPVPGDDLEERIRKTYFSMSPRPGAYVMLADLRGALPDVGRSELDDALVQLNGSPDVNLVPDSDQKALTEKQRAAAVSIGNQLKHLLAISA
jgi:hypothetical protein